MNRWTIYVRRPANEGNPSSRVALVGSRENVEPPHGGALDLGVLQLARHRHRVFRDLVEAILGEVAAARVADKDLGAVGAGGLDESQHALGQCPLVEEIADEHDIETA